MFPLGKDRASIELEQDDFEQTRYRLPTQATHEHTHKWSNHRGTLVIQKFLFIGSLFCLELTNIITIHKGI